MKQFIQAIPKYSFSLCLFVILIHDSIPAYFDYTGSRITDYLHFALTEIIPLITSIAVPSFFILSGFLFYRNYDYSKTCEKYKSRFHSLVIPYVIFNGIGLIVEMCTKIPFFESLSTYKSNPFLFQNIVTGLLFHKYTLLWFVFALILYTFLCPVFYTCLRNKLFGLLFCLLSIYLVSSGILTISLPNGLYFETTSLIYYSIGSYLGIHYKGFYSIQVSKLLAFFSLGGFIIICVAELCFNVPSELEAIVLIMKSFLYWFFFSYISQYIAYKEWFSYTFFVYLTFLPIARLTSGLLRYCVGLLTISGAYIEIILYILTFSITIITTVLMAMLLANNTPKLFATITGNRK